MGNLANLDKDILQNMTNHEVISSHTCQTSFVTNSNCNDKNQNTEFKKKSDNDFH